MVGCIVGVLIALLEITILCIWIYLCRERKLDFLKAFGTSLLLVFVVLLVFALVNLIPCFYLYALYTWNHTAGIIATSVYGVSWVVALIVCREEVKDIFRRKARERIIRALSLESGDGTRTCWK